MTTVLQILLLRKEFEIKNLVQVFGATIFGVFTNAATFLFDSFTADTYWGRLLFLFLGIVLQAVGIALYVKRYTPLTLENALLKKQIAELVMIDPVTGLYNLRSLFMDIQTQISYAERNNSPISLMILRLRYPAEMKKVLKSSQYDKVVKQLSNLIVDTVRLEDRVYSIDENGGFGIILTCDKEGTKLVEKRLRGKLDDPKWFEGISDKQIRTEVKIGYLQYEKAKYNRNANEFKDDVEEEVNYDM